MSLTRKLSAYALPAVLMFSPGAAFAAESYDNCVGFIDALPATISTQGVWCLRKDLPTSINNGNAITINANNVTIDCNDFKIGGLSAGDGSSAFGISSSGSVNVTIRHCSLRGFFYGISLGGGSGHLVEDNRLDNNLVLGVYTSGDNSRIRRNAVYDTGGHTGGGSAYGIVSSGNMLDNTIAGVISGRGDNAYGIVTNGIGNELSRNHVQGIAAGDGGQAVAIWTHGFRNTISGNRLVAWPGYNGNVGIEGSQSPVTICTDNTVSGFSTPMNHCLGGDNISN